MRGPGEPPGIRAEGEFLARRARAFRAYWSGCRSANVSGGQANPWVRYLEGIDHGFAVPDVTPARVQTDFFFIRTGGDKGLLTDPRTDPQATVGYETSFASVKGSRQVSGPVAQLGLRSDNPRPAQVPARLRPGRDPAAGHPKASAHR